MAEVTELKTMAVRSRESVDTCMRTMNGRHEEGVLENIAAVYWTKDGEIRLFLTHGLSLANLAYAVKYLDMELSALMGPSTDNGTGS